MVTHRALGLFSGGLDSILACRLVASLGVDVIGVKFVTPFFGDELLARPDEYVAEVKDKFGIDIRLVDLSEGYLELLHNPSHGFGKNFNPCIDCKILMLSRAKQMMAPLGGSFLFTGEVLGQRPMSQRRDTLRVIERDSKNDARLLRPLSAKLMKPTLAEEEGWIDRERLLDFSGRGRSRQIALAREYGITEFPAPAGGCILADPILSRRIKRIYEGDFVISPGDITADDIRLLLVGRQFLLPGGVWSILGRNERENDRLLELAGEDDAILHMPLHPGPTALIRGWRLLAEDDPRRQSTLELGGRLVTRYGKKVDGEIVGGEVEIRTGQEQAMMRCEPLDDSAFKEWML
ncbi:MAG: thiamine biosynthesis protein [Thermodesulfobacteriota bacterium]